MNRKQRRAAAKGQSALHGVITPDSAASLFASAVQHHQAGRLAEAEAHYRRALMAQPDHVDAAFNLGVALRQVGRVDEAISAYRRAIDLKPGYPEAHYNLGNAFMAQGKFDEAIAAYAQALRIKADHAGAISNLAAAYSNLGTVLMDRKKCDESVAAFDQALRIKPDYAQAHYNLGNALKLQGKLDAAAASYAQALRINPRLAEACSNLGNTLTELGRLDEAIIAHRQAIAILPVSPDVHHNLGNTLKEHGKLDDAAAAYRHAIGLNPDYAEAHGNLGIVLMAQGRLDEAAASYRRAVALKPDDSYRHSNLLFCLNYDDNQTPDSLFAAHGEWDERHGRPVPRPSVYANARTPERRLRVGYVSPDFRTHSVAYFLTPLFEGHSRQAVEMFCYADVIAPDAVTTHLRGLADHWLSAVGMPDDTLAKRIRADGIDILVDLAGHTAHNRLGVFARKPAPVQVTWLGYSNTTGLRAIDYRIVDDVTDPPGAADGFASETLLRLPGGFLCYGAAKDAPEPVPPPCLRTGAVTFGSFNNPAKVSAATVETWAQLLNRIPGTRLLLKGKSFADEATRASFLARLGERGVAAERVQLIGWLPSSTAHLALYEQIDVALDPFPYNGTTTTCEALWMGVPVVTLRGDRHSGRVGASLLSQVGLTDWIADSVARYVEIALALAANPGELQTVRRALRQRMAASSLCDSNGFARKMENAYRTIWQRWCEAPDPDPSK
jgi:predicted O-linked N-acetylglucosamine transferase (SPINDLY family)